MVRARGADHYEIIAGERRWRASQRAGLHEIPVVVLDVSDAEALELAIIENVQRSDLNPLEEASGYLSLSNEYSHSQEDIAKIVGKSRSHIANTLRLLHLPEKVKAYINSGKLTAGHARMLVGQPNAEELADQIVDQGLNVRQVEAMARDSGRAKAREGKRARTVRQGRQHRGSGETPRRHARAYGDDRPSLQRRRHVAREVPHARAARRRGRPAGAGTESRLISPLRRHPRTPSLLRLQNQQCARYFRRAAIAILSRARCASASDNAGVRRTLSAASASCSIARPSRGAVQLRSAASTVLVRRK